MGPVIFIVDDEIDFLDSLRRGLVTSGFSSLRLEQDPKRAADRFLAGETADVALIDVTMPGMNGVDLLQVIRSQSPSTECIMVTAANEARVAVECLRRGAYDYLVKPVSREDLVVAIQHALERKRLLDLLDLTRRGRTPGLRNPKAFEAIVTRSARMKRILEEAELHARSDVPVLLSGESGTGKELLARAIHAASFRSGQVFTAVNMAAVSATLFDAEFFGHTRGAFTGAEKDRAGYLEHANRGTLFLDEIGHLPQELQGKLLRVLQEGEYVKLGTSKPQYTDVRFITATNADLDALLGKGLFRKDLYYRLKGAWLHLPPLRERKEDIPLLASKFLQEFAGEEERPEIDEEAMSLLMEYGYPGNVRELRSILQSAVNLCRGRPISPNCLPAHLFRSRPRSIHPEPPCPTAEGILPLAEVEKKHILAAYEQSGRNKARASKLLGIGLNTLRRKLDSYGVPLVVLALLLF